MGGGRTKRSDVTRREPAIGLCWVGSGAKILGLRMGWQRTAGFAECAATQSEHRIGASVACAFRWMWLASPIAAVKVSNKQTHARNR